MKDFAKALAGGDRRSIGRSGEVIAVVRADPRRAGELRGCLRNSDPVVRMRAADAIEKLSRTDPGIMAGEKGALLDGSLEDGTAELRWHLIAVASRLTLTAREAEQFLEYLDVRLHGDESRIVRVMALQAAFELGAEHPQLTQRVRAMLRYAESSPMASLRARARALSKKAQ